MRELVLGRRPGTRVEYFRIDLPAGPETDDPTAGAPAPGAPARVPVGIARWTSGPIATGTGIAGRTDRLDEATATDASLPTSSVDLTPNASPDGWRSDLEVLFHAERLRVLHTERLGRQLRELVYRELAPGAGRTLYLAWRPDGSAVSSETVGAVTERREHALAGGALPLALVDLARRRDLPREALPVFRPLANAVEECTPETRREGSRSMLRLRTNDGRDAGTFWFAGERLEAFRWQAGGPVASAIPADEYARWARAMAVETPAVEAGARRPRLAGERSAGR